MTTKDKIRDEKLQYNTNRELAKIFGKIDENEYLTGEEILASDQIQMIELAEFPYSPWGKTLKEQTKRQFNALKSLSTFNRIDELK